MVGKTVDICKVVLVKTKNRVSQANLFEKWSKNNHLPNTSNDK